MPVDFEQSRPEDLDQIAALLAGVYNAPPDSYFLNRDLLAWKYFGDLGDGSTSRSYVLRKGSEILAHCAVWPHTLLHFVDGVEKHTSAVCFVDWAAGRQLPGSGILLMKRMFGLADVGIVAGGSADTRKVIPKLGFTPFGEAEFFARVVRPFEQMRTRPKESTAKAAARLARNAMWSLRGLPSASGWTARPMSTFEAITQEFVANVATPLRTPAFVNHWLALPSAAPARISAFELLQNGEHRGHFVLSSVSGQMRIADVRVTGDASSWTAAYAVAARTASDDSMTCEIVAVASTPQARAAIAECGFAARSTSPLFIYDPEKHLGASGPIFWNYLDDDTAYIYDPAAVYMT